MVTQIGREHPFTLLLVALVVPALVVGVLRSAVVEAMAVAVALAAVGALLADYPF